MADYDALFLGKLWFAEGESRNAAVDYFLLKTLGLLQSEDMGKVVKFVDLVEDYIRNGVIMKRNGFAEGFLTAIVQLLSVEYAYGKYEGKAIQKKHLLATIKRFAKRMREADGNLF